MESGMVKTLKKLLDGLVSLDKTASGEPETSSGENTIQRLEDETELLLTPQGSISEGTLAQSMPSSHYQPGFREKPASNKTHFIRRFSDLINMQKYSEALETLKEETTKMESSLLQAAETNNHSLCRQLMDKREYGELAAQCNSKDENGNSPLHLASLNGHLRVCETLLDYGENIDIDSINFLKRTPLHLACMNNHIEIAQMLVRSGASLNLTDSEGNTPVHYAALTGSKDLLEWLLGKNPDISIRNNSGKTPLDINERVSIREIFDKEPPENSSSPVFSVAKNVDFIGMIQKINELIRKSPNNSEDFDQPKLSPSNFRPIQLLGKGSFGEVFLVEKKDDKQLFAMKILMKNKIMGQNLIRYAVTERNVASCVKHPFIVGLRYSFQTANKLYLILDYCPGGSLSNFLKKEKRFPEERAKIYLCEVLLAIEELHKRDIIYRDLKPDNVVIDAEGHAMLTDFGLSKEGVLEKDSAKSFCGSVAYLAPEMLKRLGHGKAVDWYLLGALLYEMLVGIPPFYSTNRSELFYNIKKGKLRVPTSLSGECKNLLRDLLQKDPNKRLGTCGDAAEVKKHEFFYGVDWDFVYQRGLRPPPPNVPQVHVGFLADEVISDFTDENMQVLPGWTFVSN
jgi:protein-serine/threonine kinase